MILGFTSAAAWIIFLNFEQIMKWWWSCYWQRRLVCRTLEKEVGAASQPHLVIKHLSSSSSSPSHLSSPPSPSKDMAGLRLTGLEKGGDHSESCVVRFSNWLRSVGWRWSCVNASTYIHTSACSQLSSLSHIILDLNSLLAVGTGRPPRAMTDRTTAGSSTAPLHRDDWSLGIG